MIIVIKHFNAVVHIIILFVFFKKDQNVSIDPNIKNIESAGELDRVLYYGILFIFK